MKQIIVYGKRKAAFINTKDRLLKNDTVKLTSFTVAVKSKAIDLIQIKIPNKVLE